MPPFFRRFCCCLLRLLCRAIAPFTVSRCCAASVPSASTFFRLSFLPMLLLADSADHATTCCSHSLRRGLGDLHLACCLCVPSIVDVRLAPGCNVCVILSRRRCLTVLLLPPLCRRRPLWCRPRCRHCCFVRFVFAVFVALVSSPSLLPLERDLQLDLLSSLLFVSLNAFSENVEVEPDSKECTRMCTQIPPGAYAVLLPVIIGLLVGPACLTGLLADGNFEVIPGLGSSSHFSSELLCSNW